MKKLFQTTAVIAMAVTLTANLACTSNEDIADGEALTGQTLSLDGNCNYYTLANSENADWQIVECPAWVTPVKEAGSTNDAIRLYVEELSTNSPARQGVIRVSYANGVTRAVDATQTSRANRADAGTSDMKYQRSYATGWSFDVRSFSDSRGIRNQVFNIQKMLSGLGENAYSIVPATGEEIDYYYGENATELQNNISATAKLGGEYNSFKGELTGNFGRQTLSDSRRIFTWMRTRVSCVTALLRETSPTKLKDYFTDDFKGFRERLEKAVEENSPELESLVEQLVESYGTHVVLASYLGGSYDYYYSTVLTKELSTDSIKGGITASYKDKFNLEGNAEYVNSFNQNTSETVEKFLVKGGDAMQLARSVELRDDPDAVNKWHASLTEGKYELIGYDLRPIGMFFPAEVNDLIDDYLQKLYYDELPLTRAKK